jgi:hypothetical protein
MPAPNIAPLQFLVPPSIVPTLAEVRKAKKKDLSGMSVADLKQQILAGSATEQQAALAELGRRVMTGTVNEAPAEQPAPAPVAVAAPAAPTPAESEDQGAAVAKLIKKMIDEQPPEATDPSLPAWARNAAAAVHIMKCRRMGLALSQQAQAQRALPAVEAALAETKAQAKAARARSRIKAGGR